MGTWFWLGMGLGLLVYGSARSGYFLGVHRERQSTAWMHRHYQAVIARRQRQAHSLAAHACRLWGERDSATAEAEDTRRFARIAARELHQGLKAILESLEE